MKENQFCSSNVEGALLQLRLFWGGPAGVIFQASLMGVMGWVGLKLTSLKKIDARRFFGGILLCGTVTVITSKMMIASGLNPDFVAPTAGILGTCCEKTIRALQKNRLKEAQGSLHTPQLPPM